MKVKATLLKVKGGRDLGPLSPTIQMIDEGIESLNDYGVEDELVHLAGILQVNGSIVIHGELGVTNLRVYRKDRMVSGWLTIDGTALLAMSSEDQYSLLLMQVKELFSKMATLAGTKIGEYDPNEFLSAIVRL